MRQHQSRMADNISLDVVTEDNRWTSALSDAQGMAERAITAGFAQSGFSEPVSICVLLTTDAQIQTLNQSYRGKDKPTNVLSFPAEETPSIPGEPRALGDIALAFETLDREAKEANRELSDHFLHLIVHASLHLIGYSHDEDEEAERMEALEIAALTGLGVSNPYEESVGVTANYGTREP